MRAFESSIHKIVRDWLGLDPFHTDKVVTTLCCNAEAAGVDVDDLGVAAIRKLADEAFEERELEGWGL
jgi:hypothetical protein